MNTTKQTPIRPDAMIVIQQGCANCNGTGDLSDGSICPICYGTRRVTLQVTLAQLSEALARIQIACDACHGVGVIQRGHWIEDKYTYERRHVVIDEDCEQCGGSGRVRQLAASGY